MIYLYWYLCIGVVVLAIVYGAHHLKQKESGSLRELLEAVYQDRKNLSFRIINNLVAPVLAAILVVAIWPVAVSMKVKEQLQKQGSDGFPEEREFAVEREHSQERLTVQEIERREIVTDPRKAAPKSPFCHLNAAWHEFLKSRADGAELWSYLARWQTTWGARSCGMDTFWSRMECRASTF